MTEAARLARRAVSAGTRLLRTRPVARPGGEGPPPEPSGRPYPATVASAPWLLHREVVGPEHDDDVVGPAVDALRAMMLRGADPMPVLRDCRARLLRHHPTPHELLVALVEAEAVAACVASRRAHGPGTGPRGAGRPDAAPSAAGVVLVDARLDGPGASPARREELVEHLGRATGRPTRLLLPPGHVGTGVDDDGGVRLLAHLEDRVQVWLGAETLHAHAAAAAMVLADPAATGVAVVHDLEDHRRPADAAVWLRTRARAALLPQHEVVLAGDRCTAEELVRFLAVDPGTVLVLPGAQAGPPGPGSPAAPPHGREHDLVVLVGPGHGDDLPAVLHAVRRGHGDGRPVHRVVLSGLLPEAPAAALPGLLAELGLPHDLVVPDDRADSLQGAVAVLDTTARSRHAARYAEALTAGVPVVAVRSAESEALLGEGPWLVPPRQPDAVAAALEAAAASRAGWVRAQRSALGRTREERVRALGAALAGLGRAGRDAGRPGGDAGPVRPAPDGAPADVPTASRAGAAVPGDGRPVSVVLASYPHAALYDHLAVAVADRLAERGVTVGTWGVDAGPTRRQTGRDVTEVDAAAFVRHPRPRVLAVVTDRPADAVLVEYVRAFGATALTPEATLFRSHMRTRGPVGTAAVLAEGGATWTPHELVLLSLGPGASPGSGMVGLSRDAAHLVLPSHVTAEQVRSEGGCRVVTLPSAWEERDGSGPSGWTGPVPGDRLVVGCLARAGGRTDEAARVVAAVGWLRAWGSGAEALLPGWVEGEERDRLRALAGRCGAGGALTFTDDRGEAGARRLLVTSDVLVHLGDGPETTALEDLLAARAGVPVVTTALAGPPPEAPATLVQVPHRVSPLLLAESVLLAAADDRGARTVAGPHEASAVEPSWVEALVTTVVP